MRIAKIQLFNVASAARHLHCLWESGAETLFLRMPQTYSVSQLNQVVKALLESAPFLQRIEVKGEISNLTRHSSGHYYFSLKDENSQVSCVLFRTAAQALLFEPMAGDQVVATADITVYAPRGNYQLQVSKLEKEGMGSLFQRFLELKKKLEVEGLFADKHKKAIPRFPKTIGVVSSPTGAVIRDILNTLNRRFPASKVLLAPSKVQGEDAVPSLLQALAALERQSDVDVVIVARGGGSMEDLWCFNNEALVRAIFAMRKPVIAAIGHETDFTLCDFVADKRAPTPTAAAELVSADQNEIQQWLDEQQLQIAYSLSGQVNWMEEQLTQHRTDMLRQLQQQLRLKGEELKGLEGRLAALDYRSVLDRGFSITLKGKEVVKSVAQVTAGETLSTVVKDGAFEVRAQ
ncbi:MAG: exodeoxyribonuclease VII large subunit [Sphingobacteriaceae bacterium]|nr:exodeoxyribonuclease VII large subunit [Sphingobacteriaceae bacterium]